MDENNENTPGDLEITPPTGTMNITRYAPTVWLIAHFAEVWFDDAKKESTIPGRDARRREIIFSIAFAECYLFEFIRDKILGPDYSKIDTYFPPGDKKGVKEKWKNIPKELLSDGYISKLPDLNTRYWADWLEIVEFRNGLIHARSSRPDSTSIPDRSRPIPKSKALSDMAPRRPLSDTIRMITKFHDALGIDLPDWLH